jgi:t-SNARE complex subunit (syntaxin)
MKTQLPTLEELVQQIREGVECMVPEVEQAFKNMQQANQQMSQDWNAALARMQQLSKKS